MPRALFVSPHLDDVAFSCGGVAAALALAGWTTTLVTAFTRTVLRPSGFALACQLDKGLDTGVDYMALRREEDVRAAAALRCTTLAWLDLLEAPHRGYESAAALFGPFAAADDVASELTARLATYLAAADVVFVPQALGSHVDHRRVRDATLTLTLADPTKLAWYRDTPYAIRESAAEPDVTVVREAAPFAYPLAPPHLAAKLEACAAYASQIGFQFGGAAQMRTTLVEFADAEGLRHGAAGPVEVVRTGRAARDAIAQSLRSLAR